MKSLQSLHQMPQFIMMTYSESSLEYPILKEKHSPRVSSLLLIFSFTFVTSDHQMWDSLFKYQAILAHNWVSYSLTQF